jgi:hypothetical protein
MASRVLEQREREGERGRLVDRGRERERRGRERERRGREGGERGREGGESGRDV